MTRRKGRHWWWLKVKRTGEIVQAGGTPVPPEVVHRWDSEAARRLNRIDRHDAKREIQKQCEEG